MVKVKSVRGGILFYGITQVVLLAGIEAAKIIGNPLTVLVGGLLLLKRTVDWVWIDTITRLPITGEIVKKLSGFKTCLVCPGRWGRPEEIPRYQEQMSALGFRPDAVMTDEVEAWEAWGLTFSKRSSARGTTRPRG